MANIQSLYKFRHALHDRVFLCDEENIVFLLSSGFLNKIYIPVIKRKLIYRTENDDNKDLVCGLLPISNKCDYVRTTGLKYNFEGSCLQFGKLISTDNQAVENVVTVQSSHPIVFYMEM